MIQGQGAGSIATSHYDGQVRARCERVVSSGRGLWGIRVRIRIRPIAGHKVRLSVGRAEGRELDEESMANSESNSAGDVRAQRTTGKAEMQERGSHLFAPVTTTTSLWTIGDKFQDGSQGVEPVKGPFQCLVVHLPTSCDHRFPKALVPLPRPL